MVTGAEDKDRVAYPRTHTRETGRGNRERKRERKSTEAHLLKQRWKGKQNELKHGRSRGVSERERFNPNCGLKATPGTEVIL